jgi:hypothetical protein
VVLHVVGWLPEFMSCDCCLRPFRSPAIAAMSPSSFCRIPSAAAFSCFSRCTSCARSNTCPASACVQRHSSRRQCNHATDAAASRHRSQAVVSCWQKYEWQWLQASTTLADCCTCDAFNNHSGLYTLERWHVWAGAAPCDLWQVHPLPARVAMPTAPVLHFTPFVIVTAAQMIASAHPRWLGLWC